MCDDNHDLSSCSEAVRRHKDIAEKFVNAELPAWYYWVSCATKMIALIKKEAEIQGGIPDVRPIGMGGCKRRAWTSRLIKDNADTFKRSFWPVQVAVGVKAGVPKLMYAVTEHMRHNKTHVLLKLDFTNTFNSVWRNRSESLSRKCGVATPLQIFLVHPVPKVHHLWHR